MDDYIKIQKVIINDKEMCKAEIFGDELTLVSLLFNSMKSNERLAEIVLKSAEIYSFDNERQRFMN